MESMDLKRYSSKMQNFIKEIESQREQNGYLDEATCQRILRYAADVNSSFVSGRGYRYFAEYYLHEKDYQQAMHCLSESAKYFLGGDYFEELAWTYYMMGVVSGQMGSGLFALNYYFTGLGYVEQEEAFSLKTKMHSGIGYTLLCMNRYEEAAKHYSLARTCHKQEQDYPDRIADIILCLVYDGLAHALADEKESALGSLEEIRGWVEAYPDRRYSKVCVHALEGFCADFEENYALGESIGNEQEQILGTREGQEELLQVIIPVAAILERQEKYDRLWRLIELLEAGGLKEREAIYSALYPFKSKALLGSGRSREYVEYTKEYFALYDKQLLDSVRVVAQILELQDELREMERKQRDTERYNKELRGIALYDALTGLPNRAYLNEYLSRCFEDAREKGKLLGVELMDVDFFKEYNDTHGHLEGDKCLEKVAGVLKEVQSKHTFCARYGGDEFVVVYTDITAEQVRQVVERIQNGIRHLQIPMGDVSPGENVSVSQGVFLHVPADKDREWDFTSAADASLYRSKCEGRNCYHIATEFEKK